MELLSPSFHPHLLLANPVTNHIQQTPPSCLMQSELSRCVCASTDLVSDGHHMDGDPSVPQGQGPQRGLCGVHVAASIRQQNQHIVHTSAVTPEKKQYGFHIVIGRAGKKRSISLMLANVSLKIHVFLANVS